MSKSTLLGTFAHSRWHFYLAAVMERLTTQHFHLPRIWATEAKCEPATGLMSDSSISSEQWDSWNLCMTLGRCMAQDREGWQVCNVCYGSPQASTRRACGHTTEQEAAAHNYEEPPTNKVYITPKTRCNLSSKGRRADPRSGSCLHDQKPERFVKKPFLTQTKTSCSV